MKKQIGASLIAILMIIVLVTLLGTFAVKSSILGLKISTNSQIQNLLLENSNSALFNVEDPNQIARHLAMDGMFSHFNTMDNENDELVFCYRRSSMATFYSNSKASVIEKNNQITKLGQNGFCKAGEFSTGRSAVQSQIYLRKNIEESAVPFASVALGSNLGPSELPIVSNNIGVTVISILPSYTAATNSQIEACFKKTAIKKDSTTQTVDECFEALNIPYNLQHADYIVGSAPKLKS